MKSSRPVDQTLDRPDLSLATKSRCLKLLHQMCGRHTLLPNTLKIPLCYDPTSGAFDRGACGDLWAGKYHGRGVAVKVMRVYSKDDLRRIGGVSFLLCLPPHACALTEPM